MHAQIGENCYVQTLIICMGEYHARQVAQIG